MTTPLLHSKLVAPPLRPDAVTRERLLERLVPSEVTRAFLISAPAGFGKTTLVTQWLQREGLDAAWLSLDAEDNSLRRLLAHLFTAIRAVAPSLGEAELELLRSAKTLEADSLLAPLLNAAASLEKPLCIVLDDYHLIQERSAHDVFDFVLEYAPPTITLCIITRADPPLKLAKLRARAQLLELRSDDLRFSASEASAFITHAGDVELSEDLAKALTERAEGWVAGLQVMALSLAGRENTGAFIEELTHNNRFLLDYLLDEVLHRQSSEVQTFLLKTSVLDKFSPALCAALLDPEDISVSPAQMLTELERANLFLRPLDAQRSWFRYHQLFKDVLFHRLRTLHPKLVKPLRLSAAAWFVDNDQALDALELLLDGELFTEAAQLLADIGPELIWRRGDAATLAVWLERLPSEVLAAQPNLLVLRAWGALLLGDIIAMTPLLDEAEGLLDVLAQENETELRTEVMALRGFVARMDGDLEEAFQLSKTALPDLPKTAHGLRSLVNGNLGEIHYLQGDLDKAHEYHKEESRLAEKEGAVLPSRFALWRIADILTLRGELKAAKRTSHTMLNLNKIRSVDALGFADVQLGIIALAQNQLAEAEQRISAGMDIGQRLGNPRVYMFGYGPLAKTLLALGREDEAQDVLSEGKALSKRYGVSETWGIPALSAWQAYLDLRNLKLDKAFAWVEAAGYGAQLSEPPFMQSFDILIAVRILLAKGQAELAVKHLNLPTLNIARVVEHAVLKSLALAALGQQEEALNVLENAAELAAKNSHISVFLDEGEPMRGLLEQLKNDNRAPAFASKLLALFPTPNESPVQSAPTSSAELDEDFSERELSVLRLMSARLSNKEIARELDLSTNTVKWYAKGLFEKLGVHGRLKAASKAKELGLV